MKTFISTLVVLSLFLPKSRTQDTGQLNHLPEEDQNAIETIALYPPNEREIILLASLHPEILVQMENIRTATETKFKELIAGLNEVSQKKIYNLFRYPDLISTICSTGEIRSNKEMEDLLQHFPEEIRDDASFANKNYYGLLTDVNYLYIGAEEAFRTVLSSYPDTVREAYIQLDRLPAVTNILTNHMKLTVLLGDMYDKQPDQLNQLLDSLSIVVAELQAKEVHDWKEQMKNDPEAMKEYEHAAQEFGADKGYDDDVYDGPVHETYTEHVIIHEVWRPYTYWFGWPSWYADECWYPYPWWYHSGFYYGQGHRIIIVSMPSNVFFNWHFHHGHHFYHYPHFTDHVIRHYYGPRHIGSHVQPVFKKWQQDHKSQFPSHWFDDDNKRVDRIREYGKFRMDYEKEVSVKTEKSPTEREFLKKYSDRYPTLRPVLSETPEPPVKSQRNDQDNRPVPAYKPGENNPEEKITPHVKTERTKEKNENVRDNQQNPPREKSPEAAPLKKDQQKNTPRTDPVNKDQKQATPRIPPTKKDQTQPKPADSDTKKPGRG
jgi:hypothetical protein